MNIRPAVLVLPLALCVSGALAQSTDAAVSEGADAYHLLYWLPTGHLANYTEWWYFNLYDASNNVQAIFTYLINDPLNVSGGLFPIGMASRFMRSLPVRRAAASPPPVLGGLSLTRGVAR